MADRLKALPDQKPVRRNVLPVLEGGLATTVLVLAGLYLLNHNGVNFNPMGLYADYVLPAGALIVGLAAGSGYGIMSRIKGVAIRRGLLVSVVMLQLAAYVAAEYVTYLDVVHRVSLDAEREGIRFTPAPFLQYFHYKTESFAWKADHGDGVGEALGHWGYFFVALAAVGFIGGGLIAPLICLGLPYCENCQRYMRTKPLGLIPASLSKRDAKSRSAAESRSYAELQEEAAATAVGHVDALTAAAVAGDSAEFARATSAAHGLTKPTRKLPKRVSNEIIDCPGCGRGWIKLSAIAGQGNKVQKVLLSQTEIDGGFASSVRATMSKPS